jgi:hypothetical protein
LQSFGAPLARDFAGEPRGRFHGRIPFRKTADVSGYFIGDLGFLLSNFGLQNLLVYAIQFALQGGRIAREERLLSNDALYRA